MLKPNDDGLVTLNSVQAGAIETRAGEMADKLSDDTREEIDAFITAREDTKVGVPALCIRLVQDWGDDIANLPEPGSKSANNPDKFQRQVIVDGQSKKKPASFYGMLFDDTPRGQCLVAIVEAIDAANKEQGAIPESFAKLFKKGSQNSIDGMDATAAFVHFKGLTPADRQAERARYAQNRVDGKGLLVKAVKLAKQIAEVERLLPRVGVRFSLNEDGTLRRTTKPIVVFEKDAPEMATATSVDSFLSYAPETALKNGGARKDLVATASRDGSGGTPAAGAKGQVPVIKNAADFEGYVAELAAYLETPEGNDTMLKSMSGKNAENMIVSLCTIADKLDKPTTHVHDKFESILIKRAASGGEVAGMNAKEKRAAMAQATN